MSEAGNECLESKVPPGFRFHPTDEELLTYYLRKKLASERFDLDVIKEVDLNKLEPWDLHEKCKIEAGIHQTDWYFFSHKDRKYPTGTRTNRATAAGFWKATGRDKSIFSTSQCIGMRKTLVFYKGRAPHGEKTDWIMHEYRLDEVENTDDSWVVCRVFKKKCMHLKTERDTNSEYSNQLHATSDKEDEIDLPPQFMTSTGNQYYYYYNSTNQAETQGPGIIAMNNTATEILPTPSVMNQLYPAIGLASICKQELEERRSPYLSPLLQLPPLISPNKLSYDPCASSSSSSSSSSSTLTLYNHPHLSQDPIHYLQMKGDSTRQTLPPLFLKTNADEEQHLLRPLLVPNHDLLYNITSTSTAAKAKSSVGEWINPSLSNDPNSSSNNNNNNMAAPFSRQRPFDYAPPRSIYDVELWSSFCR